jgi:hypothetical protein
LRPPAQSSTAQRGCSKSMRFKRSSMCGRIWHDLTKKARGMVSCGF